MNIKKFVSLFLAFSFAFSPAFAFADTSATTNASAQVNAMLQQIQALQAQIKAMQSLQAQVASTSAGISTSLALVRQLRQGMSGDDVKMLQTILASDPTIYSGPITGFFGTLTSEAVKKFQKKNGFETVGSVGPKTLKKLNEDFGKLGLSFQVATGTMGIAVGEPNPNGKKEVCINIAPGKLIAPGLLKKGEDNQIKGNVTYKVENGNVMIMASSSTANLATATLVPPCKPLPPGIEKKIEITWVSGTTTLDTIAPVISGLSVSDTRATTSSITWNTNENANGKIWFGTSSPITLSGEGTMVGVFGTTHTALLSNLATSTTYYFVVGSQDLVGNLATSSQSSFTTLAQ
jgi:peptidoglycan hydrolase-like protein with peptidoglycan-binding domain